MAYKFTIKGIRKFNEERVIEKFFDAFKEIEKIEDVKIMNRNPVNDETDSYTVMTLNVSTQGVNIKHLVSKDILVELPCLTRWMMSSGLNCMTKPRALSRRTIVRPSSCAGTPISAITNYLEDYLLVLCSETGWVG